MSEASNAPWWLWWTNPMVKVHPDQKAHFTPEVRLSESVLSYDDIEQLRLTLELSLVPEDGIQNGPCIGYFALAEPQELASYRPNMAALTFDSGVVKLGPKEWEQYFGISDKEHIRGLITYSKQAPEGARELLDNIVTVCGDWRKPDRLSVVERMMIVSGLFFRHRYPKFSNRWILGMSYKVVSAIDRLSGEDKGALDLFCDFLTPEIQEISESIKADYVIPEVDFGTLNDFEPTEEA